MIKSKLLVAGLAAGAFAVAFAMSASSASAQGGYFGQRATQDRDYSRMSSATSSAFKGQKVTLKKKKARKAKRAMSRSN